MIRGVDRAIRKAVKDAAKAEEVSVGTWVRRAMLRALHATADGPATVTDLSERVRVLGLRLQVLENSHRDLHRKVQTTGSLSAAEPDDGTEKSGIKKSWRRARKSK
jgi:hypothetical protein